MIKDIKEIGFPKDESGKQYATLTQATVSLQDMAEKTITATVRIDGDIAPDFSTDWVVEFKGEKYVMPLRTTQGIKDNTSLLSSFDLTFQHWAVYQLKRWYFFSIVNLEAGTVLPDKYIYPISLNLGDFCALFGKVLEYYYGDTITIRLNPEWNYSEEPVTVNISHSYIWDVLIQFYELYGVRWQIEPNGNPDHYVIKVGYQTTELAHTFEYGFKGGLLKVERQVQDENIRNLIIGRGGDRNLPHRYFKQHDEENISFSPDPDWIPELKDIYFSELHGATFRSYIQGWKMRHYGEASVTAASDSYAPWAWLRGYTDTKFNPVEFVADEFTSEDNGYGVAAESSIARYGELIGGLDNKEDIYPTIQGVSIPGLGRIDQTVDIEPITSDEVVESAENEAVKLDISSCRGTVTKVLPSSYSAWWVQGKGSFKVDDGKTADLVVSLEILAVNEDGRRLDATQNAEIEAGSERVRVFNMATGEERSASAIPPGEWGYQVDCRVHNMTTSKTLNITVGANDVHIIESSPSDKWGDTWDIWIKNVWRTEKLAEETDEQYAERVWKPILGDREGGEARVVFSTGWLSTSEDYEFTIVKTPTFDTSKSLGGVPSHWRLTLGKSDADLESLGLYVPSTKRQAQAGDCFFFIGIDMPHLYVTEAEKRLDDWKKDELAKVKDIKPTWVIGLDKVRIFNQGKADAIADMLHIGGTLTLRDERFIPGSHQEKLYLTSITYTYNEPTDTEANILPDVEVVLSDSYAVSANPVTQLSGEVSVLQKQLGSISNIEQVVRAASDRLYLRKDGFADRSYSPTEFASLLTSAGFESGVVGGKGWGFFKDENGNWVLETDCLNVRQDMTVNNLVINQIEGRGGMIVESAARMEITEVARSSDGYVCYFDQKEGTIANLFHLGDVAWCNRFTADNGELKFYKRRVVAVTENGVTLSDYYKNGDGIPEAGDIIVHYGSYTDKTRQYVKVRDVIGGGYEKYIEGLDSVAAEGVEYYFVGMKDGESPRWFIGDHEGEYAEYKDKKLTLKCALSIESTVDGKTLINFIKENGGLNEDVKEFVNSALQGIQNQIDGVIETWFYNGEPTLSNFPASEWVTDKDKEKHLSDLYFDNKTGLAYRFSKDTDSNYFWNDKVDSATAKALADAARAQDTADRKRRVFTSQPTPPYDLGDLWANATYPFDGSLFKDDLLRCFTPKAKGESFSISDWDLATKYTDDTKAEEAIAQIKKLDYIKDALKDFTTINGGLVLSSLISLGVNNQDFTTQTTWSGISGLYKTDKTGGGIAAWYGGDMLDKADYYDWDDSTQKWVIKPNTSVAGLRIAQGLDRMDGTGYRAGGSIWWDANGNVHADPLSFFVGEESVGNVLGLFKFHPYNNTPFAQTTAVTPQRVFTELRIGSEDGTKSITLTYDTVNDALRISGNAYSVGDLTALGANASGVGGDSSGGSAYGRLDDWTAYDAAAGDVLSAKLGYGLKTELEALKANPASSIPIAPSAGLVLTSSAAASSDAVWSSMVDTLELKVDTADYDKMFETVNHTLIQVTDSTKSPVINTLTTRSEFRAFASSRRFIRISDPSQGRSQICTVTFINHTSGNTSGLFTTKTGNGQVQLNYITFIWQSETSFKYISDCGWLYANTATQDWVRGKFVTLDTAQTITAKKTFSTDTIFTSGYIKGEDGSTNHAIFLGKNGSDHQDFTEYGGVWNFIKSKNGTNTTIATLTESALTAPAFVKRGGTSSQFLKADGSVDNSTFATYHIVNGNQDLDADSLFQGTFSLVTVNCDLNTTPSTNGFTNFPSSSRPDGGFSLINFKEGSYEGQMCFVYTDPHPYVRKTLYNSGKKWTAWSKVALATDLNSYLPLSGGTMTGALNFANFTPNKVGDDVFIGDYNEGGHLGIQGANNTTGLAFLKYGDSFDKNAALWKMTWNGTNMSASSTNLFTNLNADLLDGHHDGDITAKVVKSLGRTNAATDKSGLLAGISMVEAYGSGANYPCSYGNVIRVKGETSQGCGELLLGWSGANNGIERVYYRNIRDMCDTWSEWRTLAFTTDNVASATKLADDSAYTAWGQTFFQNGKPRSVSGNLSNVGSIKSSTSSYGNYMIFPGLASGEAMRIESYDASGTWLASCLTMGTNGNLIVGGTGTTSYKLHVNGSQYINGGLTLAANNTICGNGGNLYIGNPSNPAYVYIQEDMQSSESNAWSISKSGVASFSSLTTGSLSLTGNLSVGGTSTLSGAVTVNSTLDATGLIGAANGISVQNGAYVWGGLYAYNGASVSGNMTVSGNTLTNTLNVTNGMTVGLGITAGSNIKTTTDVECRDVYLANAYATNSLCCYDSSLGGIFITKGTSERYCRVHAHTSPSTLSLSNAWLDIKKDRTTRFFYSASSDGDFTALSDMRKKNVLHDITLRLEDIAAAPLFIHTWKDGRVEGEFVGTSAQYWLGVLPQVVRGTEATEYSMAYGKVATAMGISLARKLLRTDDEVSQLRQQVSELQARITLLESMNNSLNH